MADSALRLLLTKRESAAALAISTRTLDAIVKAGELTPIRLAGATHGAAGGHTGIRFAVADLEALVERRRAEQTTG